MNTRLIYALGVGSLLVQSAFAAPQQEVTPFDDLQTQLVLEPGQTYLSFMKNQVKPGLDAFEQTILQDPAMKAGNYRQLQKNLIAQGAGVAIRIDDNNYIFNIGYLDGSDPTNDVKSGRSYGVGPTGKESDPSDVAYLSELEAYLKAEPEAVSDFVSAIMQVLTNCDTSGWAKLSEDGQIVATDFLAIYTAESDRHIMVDLRPKSHPWEIDLAAATFVAIFDVQTGLIMQNGELVEGSIKLWWAKGQTGSGIGNTRRDRIALQKLIAKHESESKETRDIAKITSALPNDDVIQGVLEYLNSPNGPMDLTGGESKQLTKLMQSYLLNVQANASEIAGQ